MVVLLLHHEETDQWNTILQTSTIAFFSFLAVLQPIIAQQMCLYKEHSLLAIAFHFNFIKITWLLQHQKHQVKARRRWLANSRKWLAKRVLAAIKRLTNANVSWNAYSVEGFSVHWKIFFRKRNIFNLYLQSIETGNVLSPVKNRNNRCRLFRFILIQVFPARQCL